MWKHNDMNKQSGQTLIETIVAIFILTMAITSGLAVTIYVLSNSGVSLNQVVATNLAREGVEMVRNMRDTNWLESDAYAATDPSYALSTCNDASVSSSDFTCYPKAWDGVSAFGYHGYNLTQAGNYSLTRNSNGTWSLNQSPSSYALYLQSDGSYGPTGSGNPQYYRKISISHVTDSGTFGSGSNSEIVVTSTVGWSGKGCSVMTGVPPDPATTNCNAVVTERLTNWKDY